MDEADVHHAKRGGVRPLLLYPFLALAAFGLVGAMVHAVVHGDWPQLLYLGGMSSMGWFLYRNPRILHGPAFGRTADFETAEGLEYLWLGLALMFSAQFVF